MVRVCLRDDQYERIAGWLPGKASDPGHTAADNRLFVEAVLWIARTGSPWRDLPPHFGRWNSVYQRFAHWARRVVWQKVLPSLRRTRILKRCSWTARLWVPISMLPAPPKKG